MYPEFTFNGISSSAYNIIPKSVKRPFIPPKKSYIIKIPGSSDICDVSTSDYDLMNVVVRIQYYALDQWGLPSFIEMRAIADNIKQWLSVDGWHTLTFNDGVQYNYAKIEEEVDLDNFMTLGIADIPFVCIPPQGALFEFPSLED